MTRDFNAMRRLSPRRNTSDATDLEGLVAEQLEHFAIAPNTEFARTLASLVRRLYQCGDDVDRLWRVALEDLSRLEAPERIARFNAKKFLSFQLAKILDNLQHSFRRNYQSLGYAPSTQLAKGPYPIFDNVTALFSATPVIARTATYIYACAEWIEEAFRGKELMLEIYSRLLNPTSVSLANYVVDLEAGPYTSEYFAWNFNSGMAAIDGALAHNLGRDYVLVINRNIYGGTYQLLHDWYAKERNLNVAIETFDGCSVEDFAACLAEAKRKHADRLAAGRGLFVYLESPSNPHGYVLDVPGICRHAHAEGSRVLLDATVATPFLAQPLQRDDPTERPDFVIHSYTKDMTGTGSAIAGCVIARNEDMFLPKGDPGWDRTMFWNVYYVKGAFLNADAAFEVIQGMRTLDVRMLRKCVNTTILASFLDAHPATTVHSNALAENENRALAREGLLLGLPTPLFTLDLGELPRAAFQRFFDLLSPTFEHMISLGQSNTIVSCPSLTTHSELDDSALVAAGLSPTTVRFAVGDEDPIDLLNHLVAAARVAIDPAVPGFSAGFPGREATAALVRDTTLEAQRAFVERQIERLG